MKKKYLFILLILPTVLTFTAAILHYAHGPYWISYNSDPEYVYLINSLALAELKETPTNVHPGTTLQILGAATLRIAHALDFSEKDSFENAVLKNPEFYLTIINIVLIFLNVLMLIIIGLATFNLTRNVWLSLVLQFSPFIANGPLTQGLSRIAPEPLLLFTGLVLILILVKMTFSDNLSQSAQRNTIALSLIVGFGMATKLTFAPLLIIPFFVLSRWRSRICYVLLTILFFVLWTWPIIFQYDVLLKWYGRTITHTGRYGLGGTGVINSEKYITEIVKLFLGNPLFFVIWMFSIGFVLFWGWFTKNREKSRMVWQSTSFRILVAVVIAQFCSILLTSKHPPDTNLLPALSLSGFTLFLIFVHLNQLKYFNHHNIKRYAVFAAIFFIICSVWRIVDIKNVVMQNLQIKQEGLMIYQTMGDKYKNHLKIFASRAPSPINALAFGNVFIGNSMYSESLRKIYGEAYFCNVWNGKFHTWTREFSLQDMIVRGHRDRIVIFGPTFYMIDGCIVSIIDSRPDAWKRGLSVQDFSLKGYVVDAQPQIYSFIYLRDVFGGTFDTIYTIQGMKIHDQK